MDLGKNVLKFVKDNDPTEKEILRKFNLTKQELPFIFSTIKKYGNNIVFSNGHYAVSKIFKRGEDVIIINDGNLEPVELYFSDTHSSDKGCNHKLIQKVIKEAYNRGARYAFHSGDLVAGRTVYRGQVNDLNDLTFDQQVDRVANLFPILKGLEYFVINGNHDLNWLDLEAGNVGKELAKKRNDVHFLGDGAGKVVKNGIRIKLVHLAGSCSYAESYKLQVFLRNYMQTHIGDKDRPHIVSAGHLHKMLQFNHFGARAMYPGHFQNPNAFTKRYGLEGPQGAYLVDYKIDKKDIGHFRVEELG